MSVGVTQQLPNVKETASQKQSYCDENDQPSGKPKLAMPKPNFHYWRGSKAIPNQQGTCTEITSNLG